MNNKICPLCNKLNDITIKCEKCGNYMKNMGRVQDYSDPYGPQQPINDADEYCNHLLRCENCQNTVRKKIYKVNI